MPGNERQAEAFYNCMKFKTLGKKWFETVPIPELFADFKKDDPNAVLMVDVGGNTGHDILDFHKAWPNQAGRLIVEDLPAAIQSVDKEALKPVEALEHDFFTPQPVKAAKAYYLKMVSHDKIQRLVAPLIQCRSSTTGPMLRVRKSCQISSPHSNQAIPRS